jgi:hypothetical protein
MAWLKPCRFKAIHAKANAEVLRFAQDDNLISDEDLIRG